MAGNTDRTPARHCWVAGMPGQPTGSYPALLHAWQQDEDGEWWGRVTYSTPRELGPAVVDTWVQARHLRGVAVGCGDDS